MVSQSELIEENDEEDKIREENSMGDSIKREIYDKAELEILS